VLSECVELNCELDFPMDRAKVRWRRLAYSDSKYAARPSPHPHMGASSLINAGYLLRIMSRPDYLATRIEEETPQNIPSTSDLPKVSKKL
jgi:hypothetical protein